MPGLARARSPSHVPVSGQSPLSRLIALIRSKGGQLFVAGPLNNEFLDKSGAAPDGIGTDPIGYARNLAADELGPELLLDPEFNDSAAWSSAADWQCAGGVMRKSGTTAGGGPNQISSIAFKAGAVYRIEYELLEVTFGAATVGFTGGTTISGTYRTIPGVFVDYITALPGNDKFRVVSNTTSALVAFGRVSVREVRAAYQTTTAAKPKLVREPILGPELVLSGDGTSTAGWSLSQATITSSNGEFVVTAAGTIFPAVNYTLATEVGKKYLLRGQIRQGTWMGSVLLEIGGGVLSRSNNSTSMKQLEGEFTATIPNHKVYLTIGSGSAVVGQTIIADNISVREILGYRDVGGWEFDGVDDRLQFVPPAVPVQSGFLLCAAAQRLRVPSAADTILCVGSAGTLRLQFGISATGFAAALVTDASVTTIPNLASAPVALGVWGVVTLYIDGGALVARVNGTEVARLAINGALTSTLLTVGRIGARSVDNEFANCRIQAPVIATGITTLAEVQQIEREVARLAGVTLP